MVLKSILEDYRKQSSDGHPLVSSKNAVNRSKNRWNIPKGLKVCNDNLGCHLSYMLIFKGDTPEPAYQLRAVINRIGPQNGRYLLLGTPGHYLPFVERRTIERYDCRYLTKKRNQRRAINGMTMEVGRKMASITRWLHLLICKYSMTPKLMITERKCKHKGYIA